MILVDVIIYIFCDSVHGISVIKSKLRFAFRWERQAFVLLHKIKLSERVNQPKLIPVEKQGHFEQEGYALLLITYLLYAIEITETEFRKFGFWYIMITTSIIWWSSSSSMPVNLSMVKHFVHVVPTLGNHVGIFIKPSLIYLFMNGCFWKHIWNGNW